MSSLKDRQRAAARARLERQMAERQAAAQRRKRLQAMIGAGVGTVVVLAAVVWIVVALTGDDKKKSPSAAASAATTPGPCAWTPADAGQNPNLKDVGTPPASGEPRTGTSTMTLATNRGTIKVDMDLAKAPCTAQSMTFLASKKFFDNTTCHRMTTENIFVLQCGDPTATSQGGPTYQFKNENLPTNAPAPKYPAGTVAMANSGQDGTNGSQFFIVYKDTDLPAQFTVLGKVTEGLDLVQKAAEAGVTPPEGGNPGDGKPKQEVKIQTLRVSFPTSPSATPSAAPSGSASPSPTASPS